MLRMMHLFFPVALAVWTGMNAYVIWRATSLPKLSGRLARVILWVGGVLLWMSYVAVRILAHGNTSAFARIAELVGANWIGIVFLLFVFLFLVDIGTGFGSILSSAAPRLRACALVAGLLVSVFALLQGIRAPVVQSYEVQLPGVAPSSDGRVIIFASDFHLGSMLGEEWLGARIDQIQAERPDVIILGGDLLEGDDPSERDLASSLRRLSAPLGVWAVTGNHEFHAETRNGDNNLLETVGLNVLHDQCVLLEPGFALAGVDDLVGRRRTVDTSAFVNKAIQACRSARVIVFASHAPSNIDAAAKAGAQVMLSGHTHNGQIWPFGYFVRFLNPYRSGAYEVDGMHLFVSRGAGTWGPRMRLWSRGEIVRITLKAAPELTR